MEAIARPNTARLLGSPDEKSDQEDAQPRWLVDGPFTLPTRNELEQAKRISRCGRPPKNTLHNLRPKKHPCPNTISVREESEIRSVKLHARGDHTQLIGEEIPRGFLQVNDHLVPAPPIESNSGRLDLASWMLHPEHPLTARVIVNRVWQGHFGVGLVNYAIRLRHPRRNASTHPELLDWLARWFIQDGWSLKDGCTASF